MRPLKESRHVLSVDGRVKQPFSISLLVAAGLWVGALSAILSAATAVNVTQHHNHDSRDGLYIDPAFTQAAGRLGGSYRPALFVDLARLSGLLDSGASAKPALGAFGALVAGAKREGDVIRVHGNDHCRNRVEQCLCARRG